MSLEQAKDKLNIGLRQYMHNNGKGLVIGYDLKETEKIVKALIEEIKSLEEIKMGKAKKYYKLVHPLSVEGDRDKVFPEWNSALDYARAVKGELFKVETISIKDFGDEDE